MAGLFEQYPEAVVATGGGSVMREANRTPDPRVRSYCLAHGRRPMSWREGSKPTSAASIAGRR